ncbi:MAG: PAS domain S-box protein [Bacteroidota bacterium]
MDNHQMLQAMFQEATVGIIVANGAGEIVMANPFSEKLFGYERGELVHKLVEQLLPNSYRQRHVRHRQNYHKNPVRRTMGANLELYGLKKGGGKFPISISLSHMDINGERYAIAYASDDTVRQNMLQELRESKAMSDQAQELAHVGSFEIDMKTNDVKMSDEMLRIFGLDSPKEHINYREGLELIHPEDVEIVNEYHQKMIEEKKGYDFNYRIISKQGVLRYLDGKRGVKLNAKGEVEKIFGMVQDVTDLRKAQDITEDMSKLMEESLNEIYIFDAETLKFIQVNQGARQNMGYTLAEMQELTPVDIQPDYDKKDWLALIAPLKKAEEAKLVFETIHQRKDQTSYPVEVHLQYSKIGYRPVFVAFTLDISERKKYERKLLEYSDQLEQKVIERTFKLQESEAKLKIALEKEKQLGELKSRFVSMASHEFRTPLSSILSSANLIGRYEKEEQQINRMKHVHRIESSVKNLSGILNDFLSLEKLESGKVRWHPVALDFEEYIGQVIDEVTLIAKGEQKIIHEHTGASTVFADEHLVKNILINLLSNAIKYSPDDKVVELVTESQDGHLSIKVRDYGIGIPEEDQKYMFTRFFRANNVMNIQGTGLGLTIVKRYLDLMNGKIWFESTQGEGTTFFVEIPK